MMFTFGDSETHTSNNKVKLVSNQQTQPISSGGDPMPIVSDCSLSVSSHDSPIMHPIRSSEVLTSSSKRLAQLNQMNLSQSNNNSNINLLQHQIHTNSYNFPSHSLSKNCQNKATSAINYESSTKKNVAFQSSPINQGCPSSYQSLELQNNPPSLSLSSPPRSLRSSEFQVNQEDSEEAIYQTSCDFQPINLASSYRGFTFRSQTPRPPPLLPQQQQSPLNDHQPTPISNVNNSIDSSTFTRRTSQILPLQPNQDMSIPPYQYWTLSESIHQSQGHIFMNNLPTFARQLMNQHKIQEEKEFSPLIRGEQDSKSNTLFTQQSMSSLSLNQPIILADSLPCSLSTMPTTFINTPVQQFSPNQSKTIDFSLNQRQHERLQFSPVEAKLTFNPTTSFRKANNDINNKYSEAYVPSNLPKEDHQQTHLNNDTPSHYFLRQVITYITICVLMLHILKKRLPINNNKRKNTSQALQAVSSKEILHAIITQNHNSPHQHENKHRYMQCQSPIYTSALQIPSFDTFSDRVHTTQQQTTYSPLTFIHKPRSRSLYQRKEMTTHGLDNSIEVHPPTYADNNKSEFLKKYQQLLTHFQPQVYTFVKHSQNH